MKRSTLLLLCLSLFLQASTPEAAPPERLKVALYGGFPSSLLSEQAPSDWPLDAVFLSEKRLSRGEALRSRGVELYLVFNSLHDTELLDALGDADARDADGALAAPKGWRGACPTHDGYRSQRMSELRRLLSNTEVDGVWLDYHHLPAAWESAEPAFSNACFCERCVQRFEESLGVELEASSHEDKVAAILRSHVEEWQRWRATQLSDWLREYRELLDELRPGAVLGAFVPPWSSTDKDGALMTQLGIDSAAWRKQLDAVSPMFYPVRHGEADGAAWIAERNVSLREEWVGLASWPIVQVSDWGGRVEPSLLRAYFDAAAPGSEGVIAFKWGSFAKDDEKVEALRQAYSALDAAPAE